ncbi:uncharacterized protein [Macrobrachium rosenbergii]|uniref:uncharacterized protein isoform X2 n=1 Tax=Macrobrachium rosenbergii TaxID=79674 RepID=UPI0034D3FFAD
MGIGLGIVLTVVALLVGLWLARGRRSSHTLRNPDLDMNKTTNNAVIAGEARGINDGLCVNGLMHQTIYDSSGRYRGFAYMQQGENAGPGLVYSSSVAAASSHQQQEDQKQQQAADSHHHPPSFQSKLSLLKRDSPLARAAAASKDASAASAGLESSKTNADNDAKAAAEDDGGGGGGNRKSGFVKWKWVVNHVTSGGGSEGHNSRFLDLCRLAQSKQLGPDQSRNGESAL